jgi:hypothetical protein
MKKSWTAIGLMLVLCTAAVASPVEEGNRQTPPSLAIAGLSTTTCGSTISTVFLTQNMAASYTNTSFATLPGAKFTVTVPAGQTRCVKLAFTADAACIFGSPSFGYLCYVRATYEKAGTSITEMSPAGAGLQVLAASDEGGKASAHGYTWIKKLGAGTYTIRIQTKGSASAPTFFLDEWTAELSVMNP